MPRAGRICRKLDSAQFVHPSGCPVDKNFRLAALEERRLRGNCAQVAGPGSDCSGSPFLPTAEGVNQLAREIPAGLLLPWGFPFFTGRTRSRRGSGVITTSLIITNGPARARGALSGFSTSSFSPKAGQARSVLASYTFQPICMFSVSVCPPLSQGLRLMQSQPLTFEVKPSKNLLTENRLTGHAQFR